MPTVQNTASHSVDLLQPADAIITLHPGEKADITLTDHAKAVLDAGLVVELDPEPAADTSADKKPTKTAAADSAPAAAKETSK